METKIMESLGTVGLHFTKKEKEAMETVSDILAQLTKSSMKLFNTPRTTSLEDLENYYLVNNATIRELPLDILMGISLFLYNLSSTNEVSFAVKKETDDGFLNIPDDENFPDDYEVDDEDEEECYWDDEWEDEEYPEDDECDDNDEEENEVYNFLVDLFSSLCKKL